VLIGANLTISADYAGSTLPGPSIGGDTFVGIFLTGA
jgi:hypothetical protein